MGGGGGRKRAPAILNEHVSLVSGHKYTHDRSKIKHVVSQMYPIARVRPEKYNNGLYFLEGFGTLDL